MIRTAQQALGLRSLLELTSGDSPPQALADQLVLTLDAFELYLLNFAETTSGDGTIVSTGPLPLNSGAGALTVPPGELWFCRQYSVTFAPGAAASATVAPLLRSAGNIRSILGNYFTAANPAVGGAFSINPFWMRPGDNLGVEVSAFAGAGTVVAGWLNFSRLRV